jgi:polyphosphate kinase 2
MTDEQQAAVSSNGETEESSEASVQEISAAEPAHEREAAPTEDEKARRKAEKKAAKARERAERDAAADSHGEPADHAEGALLPPRVAVTLPSGVVLRPPQAEDRRDNGKLKTAYYEKQLALLQDELAKLQAWIVREGLKVVVIFEGRDAAGKGGVIKRISERLNPRVVRIEALGTPTEREKTQWYFQRYTAVLPGAGEMVLFDRSWYNRAGVERVMGFCSDEEYWEFLRSCPEYERMLTRSGIKVIKFWFSVSQEEQERRFQDRMRDPKKRWKLSDMDLQSRMMWEEYSKAKDEMFRYTDIKQSPWFVVPADDKKAARLNCITHLLMQIPYRDVTRPQIELPPRSDLQSTYVRPPITDQTFVTHVF